jgi:hypothetical protein
MGSMATDDDIRQLKIREDFDSLGSGPWMTVCDSWHVDGTSNGGVYCALSRPKDRPRIVSKSSWDLSKGHGFPGFIQTRAGGRMVTKYRRFATFDDLEPLIFFRTFHAARPSYAELSEEFRHFHNLADEGGGRYVKIDDDGVEVVAAEVKGKKARIRSELVRQYQAARQLDLVLYIDSVVYFEPEDAERVAAARIQEASSTSVVNLHGSDKSFGDKPFSRFLAKRVLPPPPRSFSGVWPYEKKDDYFPEFIIGVNEFGAPVTHNCDPDRLANYFGANPEAPQYLTPVYFSRDVLQKYYDQPGKHSVEDGYLRRAALWGLRMDNDLHDHVVVFLGDLGRDLPAHERDYWRSFNVRPGSGISETAWRRGFLAEFADPQSPDMQFRHAYGRFRAAWRARFGWDLLRDPNAEDEHILQRVRVPLTANQNEFDSQALDIAKLMVDALNDRKITSLVSPRPEDAKSIDKLEAWLRQENDPAVELNIATLRRIQALRSRSSAHRKGKDYQLFLTKTFGASDVNDILPQLLSDATQVLERLGVHFRIAGDS